MEITKTRFLLETGAPGEQKEGHAQGDKSQEHRDMEAEEGRPGLSLGTASRLGPVQGRDSDRRPEEMPEKQADW